jgi:glutamate dehydrogenase
MDYDKALISPGGGVYDRAAKSIALSQEACTVLGIEQTCHDAVDLMRAILKAPVDLLYFGGIGTYVKASSESNADAGDRATDALRINAADLRAKVVGEGANLGFTQKGRIEAALAGRKINTDALDNSPASTRRTTRSTSRSRRVLRSSRASSSPPNAMPCFSP